MVRSTRQTTSSSLSSSSISTSANPRDHSSYPLSSSSVKERKRAGDNLSATGTGIGSASGKRQKISGTTSEKTPETETMTRTSSSSFTTRNRWIVYAVASGACAAFNGVFAKLTTTGLTTHISQGVSGFLGLSDFEKPLELIVRGIFFALNLVFNGVMWTLFTQALAKGSSTMQVSIMNTSTNFFVTAILGFAVFAESLPPLWWVGAALLVAGNVIIGRNRDSEGGGDDDGEGRADSGGHREEEEGEGEETELLGRAGVDGDEDDGDESKADEDRPLIGDLDAADDR